MLICDKSESLEIADAGKTIGADGLWDLEATGRVPEGYFLKKIDGQIDWRPFQKVLKPLYHPTQGRPSHPPVMMFNTKLR